MKKQILLVAVMLSALTITANAQNKQATPKAKSSTTATVKQTKSANTHATKQSTTKATPATGGKKAGK